MKFAVYANPNIDDGGRSVGRRLPVAFGTDGVPDEKRCVALERATGGALGGSGIGAACAAGFGIGPKNLFLKWQVTRLPSMIQASSMIGDIVVLRQ